MTQRDLDLVLANLGLQGMELTLRDGDLNGDGVVDAADVAMVLDQFGTTMFDLISFDNAGAVNGAITAGGSNVRRFQQIGGIIAPCDYCQIPCSTNCCGYYPCNPTCGAACDPGCGGDPCSPACPSSDCNPDCEGSDPCDPACGGFGGGPCGDNCNTAPCNPDCGGNAGPCNPWRVSEHLL